MLKHAMVTDCSQYGFIYRVNEREVAREARKKGEEGEKKKREPPGMMRGKREERHDA